MSGSSSEAATLFPPKVMIEPYSCPAITSLCGKGFLPSFGFLFRFLQLSGDERFHLRRGAVTFPRNLALTINHKRMRNPCDPIVFEGTTFKADRVFDRCSAQKPVHGLVPLFDKAQHLKILPGIFFTQLVKVRNRFDTRPAPRGPKLDEDNFTAQVLQCDRFFKIDPLAGRNLRSLLADLRLWERFPFGERYVTPTFRDFRRVDFVPG